MLKQAVKYCVLIGFFITLNSCKTHTEVRVLKLAHVLDISHPVHKGMLYMAQVLDSVSSGSMRMDIYPGGQLGSERESMELLQIGSLAMTKVSTGTVEGFAPRFKVLGLPYLFRNEAHRYEVLDGPIGNELLASLAPFRIRGLCFYDAGSRSFYTINRPIQHPDDLAGLKIRTMQSPVSMQMIREMGGSPTPISFGELYTALQQGVVDGAENNPPSFYLSRHYEVCKFYVLDEHTSIPDVLLISNPIFESLTEQQQEWLLEAAKRSVPVQKQHWKESVEEALAKVSEAGVEIIRPDKSPFFQAVEAMNVEFQANSEMKSLYEDIINAYDE